MHRRSTIRSLVAVAAFSLALAACGGSTLSTNAPSIELPTLPPDGLGSGTAAACVDAPTMAALDQLQAAGAGAPAMLEANKDALLAGLNGLDSSDPRTAAWRDALVAALESGDMDAAAAEVAKLASGEVTLTPC